MKLHFYSMIITGLIVISAGTVLADDWRIFGAQGTVLISSKNGEAITIKNDKSPMMRVADGSTIQVKGKGKVIVVSLKSRQGFEIGDDTTALVEPATIRSLKGSVTPRSGFAPPAGKDGKMGGIVMRGAGNQRSCLKAISPVNTNILNSNPELRWDNHCSGLSRVNLTVLSDENVVHSAEISSATSYRIPDNILKEGKRYLWMIDGGAGFDMTSGVFAVANPAEREEVQKRQQAVNDVATPEERLLLIYFLHDKGFIEMAKGEGNKLRSVFPEALGLSDLP